MSQPPSSGGGVDLGIDGVTDAVEIGRGGFATVYRARQEAFHRDVAVKVLDIRPDDEKLDRFNREARAMGALGEHRGILPLFDAGTTADGKPYILMPYMSGGSLRDALDRGEHLPWEEAFAMGEELADALHAAHAEGILHRDLKPANILMGRYGDPVLGDFGIARIAGGPETTAGTVTASLAHAAPEVLDGRGPSVASDVYGLASTIYALIAGHGPHEVAGEESVLPLITRTLSNPVPPIDGVPTAAQAVLTAAMSKDPQERPGDAHEFAGALRAARGQAQASTAASTSADPRNTVELEDSTPSAPPPPTTPPPTPPRPTPPPLDPESADVEQPGTLPVALVGALIVIGLVIGGFVLFTGAGDTPEEDVATISPAPQTPAEETGQQPADTEQPTDTDATDPAPNDADDQGATAVVVASPSPPVDTSIPPRDREELSGGVEQSVITAWMNTTSTINGLTLGEPLELELGPDSVRITQLAVQQGEVLFAQTSGDEMDTALGVLGDGRLFIRSDDDTGVDGNAVLIMPLPRGGPHTLGIANIQDSAGTTELYAALLSTTPITGPGRLEATINLQQQAVAYRFSVRGGGQGGVPAVTDTPLGSVTVTGVNQEITARIVDDRGRVRADADGPEVEIDLGSLEGGVYTIVVSAQASTDVVLLAS